MKSVDKLQRKSERSTSAVASHQKCTYPEALQGSGLPADGDAALSCSTIALEHDSQHRFTLPQASRHSTHIQTVQGAE
jgi:hypothetical protein